MLWLSGFFFGGGAFFKKSNVKLLTHDGVQKIITIAI